MNTIEGSPRGTQVASVKKNTRILLILLWAFYTVNFMYCDTLAKLEPGVLKEIMTGFTAGGTVKITAGFLLGTAVMFEIPFIMIVLSWVLNSRASRWVNIIAGTLFIVVQIGSLFMGVPSPMYIFYSIVEITALILIVLNALKWHNPEA